MSQSDDKTPLLKDTTYYDSTRTLHEVEPSTVSTLVGMKSTFRRLPNNPNAKDTSHNWVPDPASEAERDRSRTLVLCFDGTGKFLSLFIF